MKYREPTGVIVVTLRLPHRCFRSSKKYLFSASCANPSITKNDANSDPAVMRPRFICLMLWIVPTTSQNHG